MPGDQSDEDGDERQGWVCRDGSDENDGDGRGWGYPTMYRTGPDEGEIFRPRRKRKERKKKKKGGGVSTDR